MAMTATQLEKYRVGQQSRYNKAFQDNDFDLINRLEADAKRVGYSLNKPMTTATNAARQMGSNIANRLLNTNAKIDQPKIEKTPLQSMTNNQALNAVKPPVTNPIQSNTITYATTPKSVTDELNGVQASVNKPVQNDMKSNVVSSVLMNPTNKVDTTNNAYSNVVSNVLKPQTYTPGSAGIGIQELAKANPDMLVTPKTENELAGERLAAIVENSIQQGKAEAIKPALSPVPVKEAKQQSTETNANVKTTNTANDQFAYDPQKDALLQMLLNRETYKEQPRAEFKPAPFQYDVNADPIYQQALNNALVSAEASSKRAGKNVLEMMNERGLLNSSLTANQLAEITNQYLQQANADVQSNLAPQLIQQAYNRYRDSVSDQQFNVQRSDQERNQDYQRYLDSLDQAQKQAQFGLQSRNQQFGEFQAGQDQDARNRQLAMQEAGLTGNYNGNKTIEAQLADREFKITQNKMTQDQKQRQFDNALNESELLGYVTSSLSKLTGIKAGTKLSDTIYKQGLINNNAEKNELSALNNKAKNEIDRIEAAAKVTNANANQTRAEVAKEKANVSASKEKEVLTKFPSLSPIYNGLLKTPFVRVTENFNTGAKEIEIYDSIGLTKAIMNQTIPNESKIALLSMFNMNIPTELTTNTNDLRAKGLLK